MLEVTGHGAFGELEAVQGGCSWMVGVGEKSPGEGGRSQAMGRGHSASFLRESSDLLFLEVELEVLEMNGYLVSFPPGAGFGGGWGRKCSAALGAGEKCLNICPFY